MSTKKILLIIGGIVLVLGLIVALFVGGTLFFIFRTISNSEAAETARTYLRNNEKLKQGIGEVKDFGCLLYTSPSPRDRQKSRMPSSA